ncbi:MurR/RpiR family transcriptional regulator [Actinopolymorpha singaporensis]|uniref:DNA-binding transcriptional regulator, MurR/RpiR family, contains HTH and SIS domains n=1 Tax=Actinopolymorpha singaporensis TaxID=117157 RepID=A0A1H1Y7P1_9ACTN|nr:SIS domain-containing protein [Actinopolymorpha singaporensis]SDT17442.1 DNA-binding transcriptional regulator, MurR/RpiR family, contains HTH and SIS domains [Actinopolymorpha singaporensis]
MSAEPKSAEPSTPDPSGPDSSSPDPSSPDQRYGARLRRRSSSSILLDRLLDHETANLAETARRIRVDGTLEQAAARIVAARRRFVIGGSKSSAYAALLAIDLSASLANVTLVDGIAARPVDVLCDVRADDVLVAFSFRRYTRQTIAVAREFAAAGGTVVGITDDPDSSLARLAEVAVVVGTRSASYVDSPTAVAAATHILATLTAASAKGARRRLRRREEVTRDLELYEGA